MKRQKRNKWAYLYMPIFFIILGYGMIYVIFAPVLQFVSSAVQIISLNQAPTFNTVENVTFTEKEKEEMVTEEPKIVAASQIEYPKIGEQYGEITVEKLGIQEVLTFGDSDEDLRIGAGQYTGSTFPGEKGTTLIGGHNNSTFGLFSLIQENDIVQVMTKYGVFNYRVYKSEVARYDTEEIPRLLEQRDEDILILYTCYPVDMLGLTDDRLFVYAKLDSGSVVDENS